MRKEEIVNQLGEILDENDNNKLSEMVDSFTKTILESEETIINEEIDDVLTFLSHDLQLFVSDEKDLEISRFYFGKKELKEKILKALMLLKNMS